MARYRTHFTTTASITTAFAYLSRFSTTAEWDPGVVEAHDLTPDPVARGSRFEVVTSFLGRRVPLEYEIIELDAPTVVTVRAESSFVRSIDTIHFTGNADGTTTITYDALLEPVGVTRLFGPILSLAFRRIGDRAAAGLRTAVAALHEQAATTPSSAT